MFTSNQEIYEWVRATAGELDLHSHGDWAERLRYSLYGSTSGEVLGAIFVSVTELSKTPVLLRIERENEAAALLSVLRGLLHLTKNG